MRERVFTRGEKRVSTKTPAAATQLLAQGWKEVDPEVEAGVKADAEPEMQNATSSVLSAQRRSRTTDKTATESTSTE